jgi:hypothetical protein
MERHLVFDVSKLSLAMPDMEAVTPPEIVEKAHEKARRVLQKMAQEEAREVAKATSGGFSPLGEASAKRPAYA